MSQTYKNILGIDSSTSILRVGLKLPGGQLILRENKNRYKHAEFIFQLIDDVLLSASVEKASLGAIVISTGPGSFTGLRVGMSAAKGLATSLNMPIVGISTFSALALPVYEKFGPTAILIPSRRDEYYFGKIKAVEFDENDIEILKVAEIADRTAETGVIGIDFDIKSMALPAENIIDFSYGIDEFIGCGMKKLLSIGNDDISSIEPFYIQKFPAKKPL